MSVDNFLGTLLSKIAEEFDVEGTLKLDETVLVSDQVQKPIFGSVASDAGKFLYKAIRHWTASTGVLRARAADVCEVALFSTS